MASVTVVELSAFSTLPKVSSTETWGCGEKAPVPLSLPGWVVKTSLDAAAGTTVTDRPVLLLIEPSVTTMLAAPDLYRVITPLLEPDTLATPPLKVIVSAASKFTAVPDLLLTVGMKEPMVLAPLKVRLLS